MKILNNLFTLFAIIFFSIGIYYSKNLTLDASSDTLILQNDETFNYYKYYNKIFPSKNFLVLAIKSDYEIDSEYINNINQIKKKINKLDNVESTFSLVDAPILLLNKLQITDLAENKIENINNTNYSLKLILNEFSNSPLFKDQIINSEKNLSSIIIYTKNNEKFEKIKIDKENLNRSNNDFNKINNLYKIEKEKNNLIKEKLINEIRNLFMPKKDNYKYFLGGIDMITSDTIDFVKKDIMIFSIAVILFIIFILFIIYRDIKWVIIPLITTLYSVLMMTGFVGIMNWQITAISANFISLMLILSISMNIHIINNYRLNYFDKTISNKLSYTIKNIFWPCFYTVLTTIVAFGSLLFSNIKPIIDFGNIMIVALIFTFITSFTILPLVIYYFPKINDIKKIRFLILKNFYFIAKNKTKLIIFINILVLILSFVGIYKLNVENSFINYFKSNTQIYKGMKLIDLELGGTTPIDIILKFKNKKEIYSNLESDQNEVDDLEINEDLFVDNLYDGNTEKKIWFSNDKIYTLKGIHDYLESRSEIGKIQSIYSLIEMGNLINRENLSMFELSILYNKIPEDLKQRLANPFLSIENNMVKISARVKDSTEIKRNELINDINNFILHNYTNIEEVKVNGLLVLYNNMLQSLFTSQIKSFGIILISIFLMFLILFRSFKLSVIAIIPNIVASCSILGLIGLIGIPLDIMTITIAAITIGIAVDNTIHYIYRIKENEKIINKTDKIIENTNNTVGNAVLTTSLTIAFGFSVLCLSNFIPTILFGIFTALAMIIAMIGVLITLPSILFKLKNDH